MKGARRKTQNEAARGADRLAEVPIPVRVS
jgi:hypothetical protein